MHSDEASRKLAQDDVVTHFINEDGNTQSHNQFLFHIF